MDEQVNECEECGEEIEEGYTWCEACEEEYNDVDYDDDYDIDGVGFADPGGKSALRAATEDNPRNQSCPTCGTENVLTPIDIQNHYQCDRCADKDECGF